MIEQAPSIRVNGGCVLLEKIFAFLNYDVVLFYLMNPYLEVFSWNKGLLSKFLFFMFSQFSSKLYKRQVVMFIPDAVSGSSPEGLGPDIKKKIA